MRVTCWKGWRVLRLLIVVAMATAWGRLEAGVVTFEDLPLAPNSYWNGAPHDGDNTFTSNGFVFHNNYNASWDSWEGFAYSSMTDTTTPGYTNQYSAATGAGAELSPNYAVSFAFEPSHIDVPAGLSLVSAAITNTTYANLSMLNGDSFAKKFGGTSGNDPDWFKLTISGKDLANTLLGSIEFYLADFRFEDNSQDYILNTWQTVNLSAIASARILEFSLTSSDVGQWGMNTPAYFALDNLVFDTAGSPVPEPGSAVLLLTGLLGGGYLYRRRRQKSLAA